MNHSIQKQFQKIKKNILYCDSRNLTGLQFSFLTKAALDDVRDDAIGPPLPGEDLRLGPRTPHFGVGHDVELKVPSLPKGVLGLPLQRSA